MKTRIKTAHEEVITQGEKNKTIGVLLNYSFETNDNDWKESFMYVYNKGMYIFFDTIIEMINYLLYGETNMKRAYIKEEEFDEYYDAEFIDSTFKEKLNWIS